MKRRDGKAADRPRVFNRFVRLPAHNEIEKMSSDREGIEAEAEWYKTADCYGLEWMHPHIYRYTDKGFWMEYYDYPTAHKLYVEDSATYEEWLNIFATLRMMREYFGEAGELSSNGRDRAKAQRAMYVEKTVNRLLELKKSRRFQPLFMQEFRINGRKYGGIYDVVHLLNVNAERIIPTAERFPVIHGDLHFGNMLISHGGHGVKLIDPRGDFGGRMIYGDARYDLAKLLHSIEGGYDLITEDMFRLRYNENRRAIWYRMEKPMGRKAVEKAFGRMFGGEVAESRQALTLIEATLFLSMIPLHRESEERQMVMLARGYELMDEALNGALRA